MSMSDPIADMLTRIRNAVQRQHKTVNIPHSKIKVELAERLIELRDNNKLVEAQRLEQRTQFDIEIA